jgi:hypothetical protein
MFNPKFFLRSLIKDDEFYKISIFRGGLLAAVLATAVTKSSQMLPHGHVTPIPPPTHLNTPIKRLQPHLPRTGFNLPGLFKNP